MTRISTFTHHQMLVRHMLQNQRDAVESQTQVTTGKKAQDFKGLAYETPALLGAKSMQARTEAQLASNTQLQFKLELYNTTIGALADEAEAFRQDLIGAVNLNSGVGLMDKIEQHFERAADLLNTRYQGRYIFAGTDTDTAPVSATNAADFLALTNPADAFQNNDLKASAQIDDGQAMEYGVLADDVAAPFFEALHRIMEFNAGTLPAGAGAYAPAGPFKDPLDSNQQQFLVAEFDRAVQAIAKVREHETSNGVNMQTVDRLVERQGDDVVFFKSMVGQLEDVDMGEALSKLQQDQTALQASYQMIARMNQLTLLDFV